MSSSNSRHFFLYFLLFVIFFDIWFSLVHSLLNELHGFIRVFWLRTKVLLFINNAVTDWSTKFLKHLEFYIFQVLFLKSFFFSCFEFDWAFKVLDRSIITEKPWNLLCPIITNISLSFWIRFRLRTLVLVSISKWTTNNHIFLSLLLFSVTTHSIARTLIISYSSFVEVIGFEVFIVGYFVIASFSWILKLLSRVTTVVWSWAICTFDSGWILLICIFDWVCNVFCWWKINFIGIGIYFNYIDPILLYFWVLLVDVRSIYLFGNFVQGIYTFCLENLLGIFSLLTSGLLGWF